MTSILISILLALLLVLSALYWQKLNELDQRDEQAEDDRIRPLLRGLNFLLSDQPDKALQEIVRVARLRSEATDVYMFLGEMFRSKGEFGRAVRIHQNILARPHVSRELFIQAQFALASDFHAGGLLDRAVRHYYKVLEVQPAHVASLQSLLRIHEQSLEWKDAESLLSRIEQMQGKNDSSHHAYLLAEMAAQLVKNRDVDSALTCAAQALEHDASCAHAYLIQVNCAMHAESSFDVDRPMQAMSEAVPDYLFLLLPILFHGLSTDDALFERYECYFLEQWQHSQSAELALVWLEYMHEHIGHDKAEQLQQSLNFVPKTLRDALRLSALFSKDQSMQLHAREWRLSMKHFECHQCGVQIEELRWQCPQCHCWAKMRPIRQ